MREGIRVLNQGSRGPSRAALSAVGASVLSGIMLAKLAVARGIMVRVMVRDYLVRDYGASRAACATRDLPVCT